MTILRLSVIILSYVLLLSLTISDAFILSDKNIDDENQLLIDQQSSAILPNRMVLIYPDDDSSMGNNDEHELEKRRFNAWAGKRNTFTKRRFSSWAG